ncbi:hypothetical protein DSM112329_04232 [Paraconexibacter sp. AEG42_29]|uniref:DUF4386 domain-containing protein n=1 Tax=Paraconexibacter sp. AEG42_29 TaxID=2997339 RepID=A0AAU7B0H4_9ACTN
MSERHQRLCALAGFGFAPVFLIGFVFVAGFVPPPSPQMSAEAVQQMFLEDRDRIRVGILIATVAAPLLAFYVAALTHQIRQIAGSESPLGAVQLVAGSCLLLEFLFPQLVWQTAAYRPERDAATVQMLNDLAWLPFVGIVGTAIVQMVVMAIVVLQDHSEAPLLPRWSAYVSLWSSFGVASGSLAVLTHSGPLAWNGLLTWYVLSVSFFTWMASMTVLMVRASRRVEAKLAPGVVEPRARGLAPA